MGYLKKQFQQHRPILTYGLFMALLVFVLKWLQWKYLVADHSSDIYIGLIALLFTGIGIWIATQLTKVKVETIVVEKEVYATPSDSFEVNQTALDALNLSRREYEVLRLLSKGFSNAEIADHLCLSVSTVKTHVSSLLSKMAVKNRTQAVNQAKERRLTP